jgi:hypothetical protein
MYSTATAMKSGNTRFVCLLISSLALPVSFAYVMGVDNRIEAGKDAEQIAAVRQTGMIKIHGEEFVSGLVTGENCDVVISAGHTAIHWQTLNRKGWQRGELRGQGNFRFNPDPINRDDWQAMTFVRSGYEQEENIDKDEHDWSIFRLARSALSICDNIDVLWHRRDCPGDILMPGFHFDKPNIKLIDNSCAIKNVVETGVVVHDCDSKDGSSGAPLFCKHEGGASLLAINISGLTRKENYDAGVYGKEGLSFDHKQHKNFARLIDGDFYRALLKELEKSRHRRFLNGK